ncbi:MAG: pallilysin-related adhesin [Spirochaetales bacterium]|nr:pallilysin-related adhesin [Spirochaetales bacterium]
MKRLTHTLFILSIVITLAVIAFFLIRNGATQTSTGEPVRLRSIEAGSSADAPDQVEDALANLRKSSSIDLEPNETLIDLYTASIDFDDEEEQILVVRDSDDPDGALGIVIADYSSVQKRWSRSWKGSTLVSKIKTFQVSVNDLIGDHNVTIVCSGMNDANEQTMTIFWQADAPSQESDSLFAKIFEQSGSAVLVESVERPDSYKLGQSNADSWPVSVWRADLDSGNYLDQIKETWRWNYAEKMYSLSSTERIPGASIARKMAESILDGSAATFESFLDGTWYKDSYDPLSPSALFITFQAREGTVLFSGDNLIEVYEWENSNSTRYGLYIASRNQSVRNLRRLMDIELASTDSVNVRVFQDYRIKADIAGKWDGRYRRLSSEIAKSFRKQPSTASPSSLELRGEYESDDGTILSFTGDRYEYTGSSYSERGIFTVFELSGATILDARITEDDSGTSVRKSWIVTVETSTSAGDTGVQTIELQEARIGMQGIEPVQVPPVLYRKRE